MPSGERLNVPEIATDYQSSSMAASVTLNSRAPLRVKSALQTQTSQAKLRQLAQSERRALEVAKYNTQRRSEMLLKQVQDLHDLTVKSNNVAKQRTVSQLIQNSIRSENDSKLRLI